MGTSLFSVDGIDVAALVAEHIGPRLLPATLHKAAAETARDPNDPTAGPMPGAPRNYKARGVVTDFNPAIIDGNLIKANDKRVVLIGNTIEGGAIPLDGDAVTIEGIRYRIHTVLNRDAAGATYVLQARDL